MTTIGVLTPEQITELSEKLISRTVEETLKKAGYVHKDTLLNTNEAAKVLGIADNNKAAINQSFQRFCDKNLYRKPLKKIKLSGNKYRYGDIVDFIASNQV